MIVPITKNGQKFIVSYSIHTTPTKGLVSYSGRYLAFGITKIPYALWRSLAAVLFSINRLECSISVLVQNGQHDN